MSDTRLKFDCIQQAYNINKNNNSNEDGNDDTDTHIHAHEIKIVNKKFISCRIVVR